MKKVLILPIIISVTIITSFSACNNSTKTGSIISPSETSNHESFIGNWQHENSALDDNRNNKIEANEWLELQSLKERNKALAEVNMQMDELDLHVNANGTGYIGNVPDKDSNQFTWIALPKPNHFNITTKWPSETTEYYITAQGKLETIHTGQAKLLGEDVDLTTGERWTKK
jgi:hypothetical protein